MTAMTTRNLVLPLALLSSVLGCCGTAAAADPTCGSWEVVPTPMPAQADRAILRDIVALDDEDVWAVGDWSGTVNGQYQTFALAMHWDGSSWTIADIPQPAPCGGCHNLAFWAVDANGPNDVWAAGHQLRQAPDGFIGTHMLVMHYDGSSWTVMDTPMLGGGSGDIIWGMDAIGPNDVWFFGDDHPQPLLPQAALSMHWDGSSFDIVNVPQVNDQVNGFGNGNSLRAGFALSTDDIWAVGAAGDGDSLSCNLSQIHRFDGSQWVHTQAGPPNGCFWHALGAVTAVSTEEAWAGGEYQDANGYHGLALHWSGSAWSQIATPIGITDFVAFNVNNVWAFGGGIAHYNGDDDGFTLIETLPEVYGPSLLGASAPPNETCSIWAGGRQLSQNNELRPLVVRFVPNDTSTPGDLNGDGSVGTVDLLMLLANWGPCADANGCPGDLNGDGSVNVTDLLQLLSHWGGGR